MYSTYSMLYNKSNQSSQSSEVYSYNRQSGGHIFRWHIHTSHSTFYFGKALEQSSVSLRLCETFNCFSFESTHSTVCGTLNVYTYLCRYILYVYTIHYVYISFIQLLSPFLPIYIHFVISCGTYPVYQLSNRFNGITILRARRQSPSHRHHQRNITLYAIYVL